MRNITYDEAVPCYATAYLVCSTTNEVDVIARASVHVDIAPN